MFKKPGFCVCDYMLKRKEVMEKEQSRAIGGQIQLTQRERMVNRYLMAYKYKELDKGFQKPDRFAAGYDYFKNRERIEKSKVFRFIKLMPKGASLHTHDTAMVSGEFLYKLTFKDSLYGRIVDCMIQLQFFKPKKVPPDEGWALLKDMREADPEFEEFLKSRLTINHKCDESGDGNDINTVWKNFQNMFLNLEKLITYKPVFQEFFFETLKEAYKENVKYIEFRGYLPDVYDIDGKDGKIFRGAEVVALYIETLEQFQACYPEFFGCRFIFAPQRMVDEEGMEALVDLYKEIRDTYPDFVIGFDLVGQEDKGKPLLFFIEQLLKMKDDDTKFFFHAGETLWNGQHTDQNLFDAVMLGSVRIGHGYSLLKHPVLAKLVKEKGIAIEVAPISNHVLKLCDDIRSHPGAILIANNYPVVIVNDDPAFWESKGISYDWYMAFMGMSHRDADLRLLKQLAMNSIQYSGLNDEDKQKAKDQWEEDWAKYLVKVLKGCKCE